MNKDVRNGAVIKLAQGLTQVRVRWIGIVGGEVVEQFKRPLTDDTRAFKRQVTLVMEVQFKHSAVVLRIAYGDCFDRDVALDKTFVIGRQVLIIHIVLVAVGDLCADASAVFQQPQRTRYSRIRPRNKRHCNAYRLDALEVVTGKVEVEQLFRQTEETSARLSQLHERHGIEQRERGMFGQLELAPILLDVSSFQAAQIVL